MLVRQLRMMKYLPPRQDRIAGHLKKDEEDPTNAPPLTNEVDLAV